MIAFPRRWPLVPTLLVLLAVLAMVGLGIWQLQRRTQKEAMIALIRSNAGRPAAAFPRFGPVPPELLFRSSSLQCLWIEGWTSEAGRAADGSAGFRYIARCRTGAEGPGALVELGVGARPDLKPAWNGGAVEGWIAEEPDHRSLLSHLTGPSVVLRPMLVAQASPDTRLKAPARPDVANIPNNHLGYAIQWFGFAVSALIIYMIALGTRQARGQGDS